MCWQGIWRLRELSGGCLGSLRQGCCLLPAFAWPA